MKKIIAAILMALGVFAGTALVVPAPASAEDPPFLYHLPDGGYDASFTIKCSNGAVKYVPENAPSFNYCYRITHVYVHQDEIFRCQRVSDNTWYTWLTAPGWRAFGDYTRSCVVQRATYV